MCLLAPRSTTQCLPRLAKLLRGIAMTPHKGHTNWKLTSPYAFEGALRLCGVTQDGFLTGSHLASSPLSKLSKRIFHGAHSKNAAKAICRTGLVANVAHTNDRFGEGMQSSLRAGKHLSYFGLLTDSLKAGRACAMTHR